MKFEGEVKFCQILNPKIIRLAYFKDVDAIFTQICYFKS